MNVAPLGSAESPGLSSLLDQLFPLGDDSDAALVRAVPPALWDGALLEPLREFLARPSKNFRAGLVKLGYRLAGGTDTGLPLELPLIIECLHAGSLIIDDIEDESTQRRGAPALHHTHGLARSLNAANWLYFWPQALLARLPLSAAAKLCAHERLALCLMRCHEGQALDLHVRVDRVQQRELTTVVRAISRLKTGSLMATAAALGAIAAEAPAAKVEAIAELGRALGVGLQMLDDLSGVLNVARRHKAIEDLRQGRATWLWSAPAEELDRRAYDALVRELVAVMGGASCDALLDRMRFRAGTSGLRHAREHVREAVLGVAAAIGGGAWCDEVLEQFAWLERRYVQE